MSRVLVTRRLPRAVIERLEAEHDVDVHRGDAQMPVDEFHSRLAPCAGVVVLMPDRIDQAAIDAAPNLKVAANVAVGYDNMDVAYARSRGVICTNTPDVLSDAVADFTWALILDVTRRLSEGDRLIRAGKWIGWTFEFMIGAGLQGKQLGIVGGGRIGKAVAARARAFGMTVAVSSHRDPGWPDAEFMPFDKLLSTSDIVSLQVPLTADTRHLISKPALMKMKRTAFLVNTTRGPVVDEEALVWALNEHLLAGAALDVYEREPDVHRGLLALENVVLSPHLGSAAMETRTAMADLAVANVLAVLSGKPAITPI